MLLSFCRYFFTYIFRAKTRQRLLFLAVFGLIISSYALIVLQSTMGGLQHNLITRAKNVEGRAELLLKQAGPEKTAQLTKFLKERGLEAHAEFELELLVRHLNFIAPVIVHGIDVKGELPRFLVDQEFKDMLMPRDLVYRMGVGPGDQVKLISPAHVDTLMGDIPRSASLFVDDIISTDVPEIDGNHLWVRLQSLWNLTRSRIYNRIRIYSETDFEELSLALKNDFGEGVVLRTWEEKNRTLVWALGLETTVMVFLFVAMTMLVSLCITSGLMIFFDKIRGDLASFWILGASRKNLEQSSALFLVILSLFSVLVGLALGLFSLFLLDRFGVDLLPDVFVDRKIPIHITTTGVLISFLVPTGISLLFSFFSLSQFKRDSNHLDLVRSIG